MAPRVGLFFAVLFVLCFLWYFIHPAQQDLMLAKMQIAFYGFSGMNLLSFVFGLVQSFVYGVVLFGLWHLIVQGGCKKACGSGCETEKECCQAGEKKNCCEDHK
jgi:hypothetical protein